MFGHNVTITEHVGFGHVVLQNTSKFALLFLFAMMIFLCDAVISFFFFLFSFCFGILEMMSVMMISLVKGGSLNLCINWLIFVLLFNESLPVENLVSLMALITVK